MADLRGDAAGGSRVEQLEQPVLSLPSGPLLKRTQPPDCPPLNQFKIEVKEYSFVVPTKQITSPDRVKVWEESQAYHDYLEFIMAIGESIAGRRISENIEISENCQKVMGVLENFKKLTDQAPPQDIQVRYGNPAYRDWFDSLESNASPLLENILPENLKSASIELTPYLIDSFGNRTRIDYGTGHEMTFVMFVCSLFKIGFLADSDRLAVGLKLFTAYFDLARHLQTIYRMEPAGSMGVWNLDDYQFVAFILGAAQLIKGAKIKPKCIPDPEMAEMLQKDFHFFACLSYIHKVKSGPFHEHSNQLWNISAVQLWSKVFTGLIKMYRAEVLCKFPVVQHSLFGSIFNLEKSTRALNVPGGDAPARREPVGPPGLGSMPMMPGPGVMPMMPGLGSMPLMPGPVGMSRMPDQKGIPDMGMAPCFMVPPRGMTPQSVMPDTNTVPRDEISISSIASKP